MRKLSFALALAVMAGTAILFNACKAPDEAGNLRTATKSTPVPLGATPHPTSTPNDGVRRISVDETLEAMKKGEAVVVDVRAKPQYDENHIKGSISIPRNEIDKRLEDLPKDKLIIFYCA